MKVLDCKLARHMIDLICKAVYSTVMFLLRMKAHPLRVRTKAWLASSASSHLDTSPPRKLKVTRSNGRQRSLRLKNSHLSQCIGWSGTEMATLAAASRETAAERPGALAACEACRRLKVRCFGTGHDTQSAHDKPDALYPLRISKWERKRASRSM